MKGKVVKVIDGDTCVIEYYEIMLKCRLANINAPELKAVFGKESRDYLAGLVLDQSIDFEVISSDPHGRYVVIMILGNGRRVDELIVGEGMAWHWEKFSENSRLIGLQHEAYKSEKGLWQAEVVDRHYCEKCLPIVQERRIV